MDTDLESTFSVSGTMVNIKIFAESIILLVNFFELFAIF